MRPHLFHSTFLALVLPIGLLGLGVALAAAPTIGSFTPASGTIGAKITVKGSAFTGATAVKFNGVKSVFKVINSTTISANVPVSVSTGKITVTTPGGTGTSAANFTVTPGAKVAPGSGWPAPGSVDTRLS